MTTILPIAKPIDVTKSLAEGRKVARNRLRQRSSQHYEEGCSRRAFSNVAELRRSFGLRLGLSEAPAAGCPNPRHHAGLRPGTPPPRALCFEADISGSESNRGGCSRRPRPTLSDSRALWFTDPLISTAGLLSGSERTASASYPIRQEARVV